jgi:hypothetical protein
MNSMFPDYARYADVAKELEAQFAYHPEKAVEIIAAEMEGLGAEMVDGKWHYDGDPVELIFLLRTEDERLDIGDYVSNLLEEIGFTVNRQYKTSPELRTIVFAGNENSFGDSIGTLLLLAYGVVPEFQAPDRTHQRCLPRILLLGAGACHSPAVDRIALCLGGYALDRLLNPRLRSV